MLSATWNCFHLKRKENRNIWNISAWTEAKFSKECLMKKRMLWEMVSKKIAVLILIQNLLKSANNYDLDLVPIKNKFY